MTWKVIETGCMFTVSSQGKLELFYLGERIKVSYQAQVEQSSALSQKQGGLGGQAGDILCCEGDELCCEGDELCCEGDIMSKDKLTASISPWRD